MPLPLWETGVYSKINGIKRGSGLGDTRYRQMGMTGNQGTEGKSVYSMAEIPQPLSLPSFPNPGSQIPVFGWETEIGRYAFGETKPP